ncbi:MAG TPA: efflux RND transporter permease subunit, partial [Nannocystaceae bacterium]|nr:efflux RND transporter permease subunit [Nannocystaceae bacterium]
SATTCPSSPIGGGSITPMVGRSSWLVLAIVCACTKDPPPPPPQQDPIVAIAAALHGASTAGPVATIHVALRGADVASVEQQVLVPLEHAASRTPGVTGLAGVAFPDRAQLSVTFEPNTDPYAAMTALRDALPLDMLPPGADSPVIERIDRDALPLFAMFPDAATAEARGPDGETAITRLAYAVMREPGVARARWCGVMHDVLVVDVDVTKLAAFGIGIDRVLDVTQGDMLRPVTLAEVTEAVLGTVRLRDVATLSTESREGSCTVVGPTRAPTIAIWAKPEGIANAKRVLQAQPALRLFTTDDPLAIVNTTLAPDERRAIVSRWLARDNAPAWLVQEGDEEAWLLASPSTSLRSFSMAAANDLHMWWPDAPPPLSARVCGDDLEVITQAALKFAMVSFDDLLDDVAVWIPPSRPQRTFTVDREAVARHGISMYELQRLAPLLVGEELRVREDLVVRVALPSATALTVKGSTGTTVPVSSLGTVLLDTQPAFITRFDRQRCIAVDLQPRRAEDRAKIEALVQQRIELPVGVYVQIPAA